MKRTVAFLLAMVLCLAFLTSASATYYRADYEIAAGKVGYSPSSIYHTSGGGNYAKYHLERYIANGTNTNTAVNVHMWNRELGQQVTSRLACVVGNEISLVYLTKPTASQTLKPVTYKTNTSHYNITVHLYAEFQP